MYYQSVCFEIAVVRKEISNKMVRIPKQTFQYLVLLTFLSGIRAVDIEDAYESPCFDISKTAPVDINWV